MRGGVRLPAVVVTIGLLAGCSDPGGAVKREGADARKTSPSPRPRAASSRPQHRTAAWWQPPARLRTANGLRVRTGALRGARMRVAITDVAAATSQTIVVTTQAHGVTIGRFALTDIKIAKSSKTGTYGVSFHYRRR